MTKCMNFIYVKCRGCTENGYLHSSMVINSSRSIITENKTNSRYENCNVLMEEDVIARALKYGHQNELHLPKTVTKKTGHRSGNGSCSILGVLPEASSCHRIGQFSRIGEYLGATSSSRSNG